jgi:hypothetical protein
MNPEWNSEKFKGTSFFPLSVFIENLVELKIKAQEIKHMFDSVNIL